MVDFRKLMSPELRARSDAERVEMIRLWRLPDRFLAADLLRKVRSAREMYPKVLGRDLDGYSSYETSFAWDVVPEVAARLGETDFLASERKSEVRACSDVELRDWVGSCLKHMGMIREAWIEKDPLINPWLMLTHSIPNGNPVLFAMDRVSAPTMESTDWGAAHVREIARHRGFEGISAWSPMLQNYERSGTPTWLRELDPASEETPGMRT
ncbi:hypothetical protein G6L37_00885 [Agrobacterium rubi]|nr:hypothetical protein [Agrobacterium rubi]NTF23946.1 hypothetical protein [Agrobacterium rubi]